MIIDGRKIAENIIAKLKKLPKPDKILAAILVGENSQSKSFLRQKEKIATELGVNFQLYKFSEKISESELTSEIKKIGEDEKVGGIIVQLPLPSQYNRDAVLSVINPKKDIDVLSAESWKFALPLPVEVVSDILENLKLKIQDFKIAVVGRGFLVGKPIMEWLKKMKQP